MTREDQTLINRFARLNAKLEDLDSDLKQKKRQLENTLEAMDELFLQDEHVLVMTGEVFAKMSQKEAQEWTQSLKLDLDSDVNQIETNSEEIRSEMSSIKAKLYLKFGSQINLENDE